MTTLITLDQWSRPEPALIRGVRPNSPHSQNQRVVQAAALIEIFDQGGEAAVEFGQQPLLQALEVVGVRIPAADVDRDEPHAGFDQPTAQEHVLPPIVAAIAIAKLGILLADVERFLHGGRGDQVPGLLRERVHSVDQARGVGVAAHAVELLEHRHAVIELLDREPIGQFEIADAELVAARVAQGFERVVSHAQVRRGHAGPGVGKGHVGRETGVLRPQLMADDAPVAGNFVEGNVVGRLVTGQQHVRRRLMSRVGMRHRTEDRQPVDHPRRIGQMFRNLIAGDRARNGIERAAEFGRSLGLEIPHVEMAGAAPLPQQDHAEIFALRRIGLGGEPHPIGQSEAAERQGTDLEQIATRDSVAGSILFSANAKHVRGS